MGGDMRAYHLHYNEGWAHGFELGIKYWGIWNEPDLDADDAIYKKTWGAYQFHHGFFLYKSHAYSS